MIARKVFQWGAMTLCATMAVSGCFVEEACAGRASQTSEPIAVGIVMGRESNYAIMEDGSLWAWCKR